MSDRGNIDGGVGRACVAGVVVGTIGVIALARDALARPYPPGFVWNQNTDWVSAPTPNASTGNPAPDSMGNPVWEYAWTTGGGLGSPNPWYAGTPTRLVWDPSWFGQAGNENWVLSNDTAPSQGRGSFLTPGAPSATRVSVLRWVAPETLPNGLFIDGWYEGSWTNNSATYQTAIARLPGGDGGQAQLLFSDTLSSIWNNSTQPVHLRVPQVNAGDVIVFSARATADHGWWTIWTHNLKLRVAKAPSYPIGFTWNRRTEWQARPDYDANTTYGNPALDTQDSPVWEYGYTSGGSVNSANPWFANPVTRLRWDPSWYGQTGNGNWTPSNDTAPAIGSYSTYGVNTPSAEKIGVVRWIAPATLAGGLRITGNWSVRWENTSQPYEGVIARLPAAGGSAQVLLTRTFTSNEHDVPIPVDVIVPVVNAGDIIVVSARATADHGWYVYFQNDLTFTHNCPEIVFTQQPAPALAIRAQESAVLSVQTTQDPDLPAFGLTYSWRRDGVALEDGPQAGGWTVSGATMPTLAVSGAIPESTGVYTCAVTNSCRTSTSEASRLAVYPRNASVWQRSTEWTAPPASAAGTSVGNPDDDARGIPVWTYGYTTGGGSLNSASPWFLEPVTPMVWDTAWFGQAGNGVWAAGDDLNPPIGSGALTDNRVDSAGRIPVVVWTAPVDLPGYVRVFGPMRLTWSGGGDAPQNRAPADIVIALQRAAGGPVQILWSVNQTTRPSCTFIDCPYRDFSVNSWTTDLLEGDRILISTRALRAGDGHPQHGWNVLADSLRIEHQNWPRVESMQVTGPNCMTMPRAATITATVTGEGPLVPQWRMPDGAPVPNDPRFSVTVSPDGRTSTLSISNLRVSDPGQFWFEVHNPYGSASQYANIRFCFADFDCNGGWNIDDLFYYLSQWFTGNPRCDVDAPDGVGIDDIFIFINTWFAGGGCF